jgi:hypothetical protein
MATRYKANCKCGYEAHIFVGGTMLMAPIGTYHAAVLCRECRKPGSSRYGGDAPKCEFCQRANIVRYDDPELRATTSEKYIGLTSGLYFCPQCKEFGLSFEDVGPIFC